MRITELHLVVDDEDENGRLYKLPDDVIYRVRHPKVQNITVPKGFKTDLATLPPLTRGLVWLFGYQHDVNSAGVLHDWLCACHMFGEIDTHRIFYQELRDAGVPVAMSAGMFVSVLFFGSMSYKSGPERLKQTSPELAKSLSA